MEYKKTFRSENKLKSTPESIFFFVASGNIPPQSIWNGILINKFTRIHISDILPERPTKYVCLPIYFFHFQYFDFKSI